jgi:hypothetical protein
MPTAIIATIACHMEREREQGGWERWTDTRGKSIQKEKRKKQMSKH